MTVTINEYLAASTSGSATGIVAPSTLGDTTILPGDKLLVLIYRYGSSQPTSLTDNGNDASPEDSADFIGEVSAFGGGFSVTLYQINFKNSHTINGGGSTWKFNANYPDSDVGGSIFMMYLVRGPCTIGYRLDNALDAVDMVDAHDALIAFEWAGTPVGVTPTPGSWTANAANGDYGDDFFGALLQPAPLTDYTWDASSSFFVLIHPNPSRAGNPRTLAGSTTQSTYFDVADDNDDDEVRVMPVPGNPQVGDWLVLFVDAKGSATPGPDWTFLATRDGGALSHETSVYVREIDGTEDGVYVVQDVKSAVMTLTTMGDQAASFNSWVVDKTSINQSIDSPDGVDIVRTLTVSGVAILSLTPGDTTFSLTAFASKTTDPDNPSTAYPFGFPVADYGTDSVVAFGNYDVHGPAFTDTQDWVMYVKSQDDRDATVALEDVAEDYNIDLEDISFNSLSGSALINVIGLRIAPSFVASSEAWDSLSTVATIDHDLLIGQEPDQHHDEIHPLDETVHTGGFFYRSAEDATITDADFSTPTDGMVAMTHDTVSGTSLVWIRSQGIWESVGILP